MPLSIARQHMPLCVGGGQHRLDEVRDGLEQMFEELPCGLTICLVQELGDCELAGSVNGHKEKELALHGLNFGDAPSRACKYALPGNEYEKRPIRYRLNCCRFGLSLLTSGKREMPYCCSDGVRPLSADLPNKSPAG